MHKFERELLTELRRLGLNEGGRPIIVAVSGGADSMSLLIALAELAARGKLSSDVVAAHFDHRLRKESANDSELVRANAEILGLRFVMGEAVGDLAVPKSGNLEQNARIARYRFLSSVSEELGGAPVLTAHTMNDRAETFLMNLLRGSGIDGLIGIAPRSEQFSIDAEFAPFSLYRPLVGWARRESTESYCLDRNAAFVEDPMNSDRKFTRVRIRREILPLLKEINPKIIEALCRTAESVANAGMVVPELGPDPKIASLIGLEPTVRLTAIRAWLGRERGSQRGLTMKHVESVNRLILSRRSGNLVEIPGGFVIKRAGRIVFEPRTRPDAP